MSLSIKHLNAPAGLEKRILHLIYKKERFLVIFQSIISILSFIAFFPLASIVAQSFSNSGLSQYFSLLFSGDGMLAIYWQELTLSIVEALPLISITIFLAVGVLFTYSLNRTIKNGRQFLLLKITA